MEPTEDQGPRIVISIAILQLVSALFLAVRVYCKILRHQRLWWDDHILIVSWVLLLISVILSIVNVRRGLGKHIYAIPPENLADIGLVSTLDGTFSILAASLSKTAFAVTLLRILKDRTRYVVWFIIATINITMGLSALFGWVRCAPVEKVWRVTLPGTCWPPEVYSNYGMASGAYSGVMDIVLALLPWRTIMLLQMKLSEKLGVAVAMSMGIFAGVTAFVKTAAIPALYTTGDFTYYGSDLVIWGTAESAVTIVAASIPLLRAFAREAVTKRGYGSSGTTIKRSRIGRTVTTVVEGASSRPARGQDDGSGTDAKNNNKRDDRSDRSILKSHGGILQTNEIRVESHGRRDSDSESTDNVYELREV